MNADERRLKTTTALFSFFVIGVHLCSSAAEYAFSATC
jgi:hypothetical protein